MCEGKEDTRVFLVLFLFVEQPIKSMCYDRLVDFAHLSIGNVDDAQIRTLEMADTTEDCKQRRYTGLINW